MTRDRLVSAFVVLAALTVATIVVWLLFFRPVHEHTTVRSAPPIVSLPPTPLQAQHARQTAVGRSPDSRTTDKPLQRNGLSVPSQSEPQKRPLPSRKPKTVKTKPDRRRPQQRPQQPAQPSNPPSPPPSPSKPPVCVRAPAPVTLSTPAAGVNSC